MSQPDSINYRKTLRLATAFGMAAALSGVAVTFAAAPPKKKAPQAKPAPKAAIPATTQTGFTDNTPLTEEQRIVHALNRLGFGPRPGDVERVKAMGLPAYIDKQLNPHTLDDSAVEAKLADFPILEQSNTELASAYYDTLKGAAELRLLQARIQMRMKESSGGQEMEAMAAATQPLAAQTPEKRAESLRNLYAAATPEERKQLQQMMQKRQKAGRRDGVQDASRALQMAKVIRATESERQLYEVMSDFWGNHFNIDIRKNQCRVLKVADEREVVRKHALGKFRDILGASAHSPAMMVYLDNAQNVAPPPEDPRRERMRQAYLDRVAKNGNPLTEAVVTSLRRKQGINENYAREIMELHTLGVDGGYTQKDVQEVARCFTGWGVGNNARTGRRGEWVFNARNHDNGEKTVLGTVIPANGGEADGEKVLDLLASHPSTMKYVSTKLCKRLVSDEPPASLVNKCVATWKRTDGDIREIVRTIATSPEFYSRAAYRQKIKSPFEYAVSSVRAVGGTFDLSRGVQNARLAQGINGRSAGIALTRTLAGQVTTMGQPLYQFQAPTGYPEDSRKWVSSGALISRLNFALGLMRGDLMDVRLPQRAGARSTDAAGIVGTVTNEILNGDVSPATRATLLKQANAVVSEDSAASGQPLEQRLTALVLGSPEFQRR